MKFSVIVADPPFSFSDQLKHSDVKRGATANYQTMSISDIKSLPIKDISDPEGAVLALWVPSALLQEGLDIMKAWGFVHKQTFIWNKIKKHRLQKFVKWMRKNILTHPQIVYDKFVYKRSINSIIDNIPDINLNDELGFGMGKLFRNCHEICLIGVNSNKIYKKIKNKSQRSVCLAENWKHSAKPEELQDSLELMFPNCNYLEIFARRQRLNWVCLGNEAPMSIGEDINTSFSKLI